MGDEIVEQFRVRSESGRVRLVLRVESQAETGSLARTDRDVAPSFRLDDGRPADMLDKDTFKDGLTGEIYHRVP
jgi:hypothetical protein